MSTFLQGLLDERKAIDAANKAAQAATKAARDSFVGPLLADRHHRFTYIETAIVAVDGVTYRWEYRDGMPWLINTETGGYIKQFPNNKGSAWHFKFTAGEDTANVARVTAFLLTGETSDGTHRLV